ncbi:MAG: DegT/DnrJ/EryC1/StrS family aminotransferase, partial [Ardenticatenaceae bacterium]
AKNVYWLYSILITDDSALNRDELIIALRERNIDARPFFYPMHQLPPYQGTKGTYPIADELSRQGLNLPSYPTLTHEQVQYICDTILELCAG